MTLQRGLRARPAAHLMAIAWQPNSACFATLDFQLYSIPRRAAQLPASQT